MKNKDLEYARHVWAVEWGLLQLWTEHDFTSALFFVLLVIFQGVRLARLKVILAWRTIRFGVEIPEPFEL